MSTLERRECLVYIVESPSPEDDYADRREGDTLHKLLKLKGIESTYHRASSTSLLYYALEEFKSMVAESSQKVFLLHLRAHGSSDGIFLTDGSTVSWADLKAPLATINDVARGRVILCMSSCEGFAACGMAMDEVERPPFLGVIGNSGKPTWSDTAFGFAVFYNLYVSGHSVKEAVNRMRLATDNHDFCSVTAQEARQAYLDEVQKMEQKPEIAPVRVPQQISTAQESQAKAA